MKRWITASSARGIGGVLGLGLLALIAAPCAVAQGGTDEPMKEDAAAPEVSFQHQPGKLLISVGGEPFAAYVYEDAKIRRPYFAHVKAPSGVQATRNHPPIEGVDAADHDTMHPGIWLGLGDVNGNDYWRNKADVDHEMFIEEPKGGPGRGTFAVRNFYMNPEGTDRLFAREDRYQIIATPEGTLLTQEYTFHDDDTKIVFGDQEEMGMGIRVNSPVAERFGGKITNADGKVGADECWGQASKWIDYSGEVEGKPVGMTIMPSPNNFRPSWYHARNYGFIAANPFGREAMKQGEKSAVPVEPGEKFKLGFAVLVHSKPDVDIEKVYAEYVAMVKGE